MHLLIRTDCDTQIFVDPCRLAKMPHINIVFLQCFKQFHTGNIRMHGKNKVAFGITKYEPECPKLLFGPLSCLYDFLCRLFYRADDSDQSCLSADVSALYEAE